VRAVVGDEFLEVAQQGHIASSRFTGISDLSLKQCRPRSPCAIAFDEREVLVLDPAALSQSEAERMASTASGTRDARSTPILYTFPSRWAPATSGAEAMATEEARNRRGEIIQQRSARPCRSHQST
jgi:hypothetical protein